ncbi:MAG: hypothetical protein HY721_13805 [Planctomycetes bacterium]|nr:hypothetical protein [Planctomycetota bacterium]
MRLVEAPAMAPASGAESITLELKAIRRLVTSLALCGLAMVCANFALDLWRRHDFEREGEEVRGLLEQVTTRVEAGTFLLGESDRVARGLEDRMARLAEQAASARAVSESENVAAPGSPEAPGGPAAWPLEELSPAEILDAPLEDVLPSLDALRDDPFLADRYGGLLDPRFWKAEEIIAELEGALGHPLSSEEREAAGLTVGVYREAAEAAYGRYQIALDTSMAERALGEDFDRPLPSGDFAPLAGPPEDVLAVALVGSKRYVWEKARYPELHRKNAVYQYLPLAMLERLRGFFDERSPR